MDLLDLCAIFTWTVIGGISTWMCVAFYVEYKRGSKGK